MKTRFIVLIDFSAYSDAITSYAYDWSQQVGAELLFVHQSYVLAPALTSKSDREYITEQTTVATSAELLAFVRRIIPSSVPVSSHVSPDSLLHTLSTLSNEPYTNVVIMGIKGTSVLKQIFLGSVATQIIDSTDNLVVAMPKEVTRFAHEMVYIAVTKKHPLNILELNKLLKLIRTDNTTLTFFNLAKPNEHTQGIEKYLADLCEMYGDGYQVKYATYRGISPSSDIKKVINCESGDLLVVQRGSRLLTDQLFRKYLINELVYEGLTPLVVLP